ncbi:putative metal-binding motif-containing protein [Polyangium sp. 15x6]|uniref:putative metal-binding motif-containing protein n=1 Tax=Polyangium sp. 15x6 TaxID=3042687 RepID=UPI00249A76B3|nr:putative metal-binding motif-containing protein [Polyangium sp. 15x6]MDI3283469.1 putative metal-binding motif-containing protein [Polyangium sp. 15x6]
MLKTCVSCEGFVPGSASSCPHCGAAAEKVPSALAGFGKSLAALATGGAMAVTLMACYGLPPCDPADDKDGDGFCPWHDDCDDTNKDIHPGAQDTTGDGIDQNCDGTDGVMGDGGACLSCVLAMSTQGATEADVCPGDALTAYQALKQCACQAACAADCQDEYICTSGESTADCQGCVTTQCSTQRLDCQEN